MQDFGIYLIEVDGVGSFVILKQSNNYETVEDLYEELINEQGSNFKFDESVNQFEESIRRSNNLDLWGDKNNLSSKTTGEQTKRESKNARIGDIESDKGNNRKLDEDTSNQSRDASLTDREILELAANELVIDNLTEAEQSALEIFKNRLTALNDLYEERVELGKAYVIQQFSKKEDGGNRQEAEKTKNRMDILDN